jgi:hypothetical protein
MNPIRDVLLNMLLSNANISDDNIKEEIHNIFIEIFKPYLKNEGDLIYLDFKIKKSKEYYKFIANNLPTSLWSIGILMENPSMVMKDNKYKYGDKIYTFNNKTKTLKYVTLNK